MQDVLELFIDIFNLLIDRIYNAVIIDVGGYNVPYFWLIIGFIAFGMVISVFWKGARG